jgi:hypothetical protein
MAVRPDSRDYAAAVYGSLLVTTLLAVQWHFATSFEFVSLTLVLSIGVFWLAHVWAELVNLRIRGSIGRQQVVEVAVEEAPIPLAAFVPAVVMAVLSLAGRTTSEVIAVGLFVSVVQLFLWGMAVGRAAHHSLLIGLAVATVDLVLGLVIVGLEVAVLH